MRFRPWFVNLLLLLLVLAPVPLAAQAPPPPQPDGIPFKPQIEIPGFGERTISETTLPEYISALFNYLLGVIGILAVAMIVYGGFRWITAAGNPGRIQAAKEIITSAIIGLVLALTSVLLLRTINPNLVSLRIPTITKVQQQLQGSLGSLCSQTEEGRAAAGDATCGKKVTYTTPQGARRECVATFCENPLQACLLDPLDGLYVCGTPQQLCTNFDEERCEDADTIIARLQPPVTDSSGTPSVCRRRDENNQPDECILVPRLGCANNESRVSCNIGGSSNTDCWQDGAPAQGQKEVGRVFGDIRLTCTDNPRAGVGTDAICCAVNVNKHEVYCMPRPPSDRYIEASCEAFNPLPGVFAGARTSTCGGGNRCYIWIRLRITNEGG